jgi:hypothetical protein
MGAAPDGPTPQRGTTPPLVGRDREQAALRDTLAAALAEALCAEAEVARGPSPSRWNRWSDAPRAVSMLTATATCPTGWVYWSWPER